MSPTLRARIAELESADQTPQVRLALAEARFRVAVAPRTEAAEAIALLRTACSLDPFAPKLPLHLGRLLHGSGRPRAALTEYRRAVRLAPTSRRAHVLMAMALLELEKPEHELGQVMLDAAASGSAGDLRDAVTDLDELLAARRSGDLRPRVRPRSTTDGDRAPARSGFWRAGLLDQLAQGRPQRRRIEQLLDAGAAAARSGEALAEYAASSLLLLVAGDHPDDVRDRVLAAAGTRLDHPAVALVDTATRLAEHTDGDAFVEDAGRCLAAGQLPVELVCWLHHARYGPHGALPAAEALRLLAGYPAATRDDACFRELRLAVLDGYARRAWTAGRFAEAKLLWQEAIAVDPYRIPVALNLALLAARTAAADDYDEAWTRLAELLYLHPAATGDVQLALTDRANLHLALAQHSRQRYCSSTQADATPTDEEIAAWLDDRDAVEVWLREWDRYYLNARLRFRSPVHQLGVAVEAIPTALRTARDSYVRHLDTALRGERLLGVDAYCDLAAATIAQAFDRVVRGAESGSDPYYDVEKERADALLGEAWRRGMLLRRMLQVLADQRDPRHVRLGALLTRHQLALPWTVLQPLCVEAGLVDDDVDLVPMFENDLVGLAELALWDLPADDDERARRLADVATCRELLPRNGALRLVHGGLLKRCGRLDEAYRVAVEALAEPAPDDDPERLRVQRSELAALVDSIGLSALPEGLQRPMSRVDVEREVVALRQILLRYPQSAAVRRRLADRLVWLREDPGHREAAALLTEGIELAMTDEQRAELRQELAALHTAAADDVVRRRYDDLIDAVLDRVSATVRDYNHLRNVIAAQTAKDVLRQALAEVTAAQHDAAQAGLTGVTERLSACCAHIRDLQAQFGLMWA